MNERRGACSDVRLRVIAATLDEPLSVAVGRAHLRAQVSGYDSIACLPANMGEASSQSPRQPTHATMQAWMNTDAGWFGAC